MINQDENEIVIDALLSFKLPPDQLPGTDQLSKSILKTSTAIDIITSNLLDVPKGTYTIAGTEWANGSRSDILYVPYLGIQNSLPPILIEVQSIVNVTFMERLVK
ncbi:hypothetical protein G6F70_008979 [Rhizopus microsporus]|nr:hypothetical protein G6F71_008938 [Rhizopus microsporus]KAG1193903.1 hypothetical protein G6F70_008979 [Rhizopus microsporus]KAG1206268.1 hypothetical protein G6F69_008958 [Rhizopus microsporus]KAG1226541.1 hypothetical protein G6F67_008933 [Rhizopus microsporus]KAG1245430.1 hypothetical protein G6F68_015061 [Rhizopus microsporus]